MTHPHPTPQTGKQRPGGEVACPRSQNWSMSLDLLINLPHNFAVVKEFWSLGVHHVANQ